LLACHERQYLEELTAVSEQTGLILSMDGLAPEGGEPQLWVVQRGLEPAVPIVFPHAKHGFCQMHYFKNAAEPVAEVDGVMKVTLRQAVRSEAGDLIRREKVEKPGVLTVTGLVPSSVEEGNEPKVEESQAASSPPDPIVQEQEEIVQDLLRRVRYLLTLKGRPPFRLAGIEMFVSAHKRWVKLPSR
jgi:hypothetical protein